MHMPRKVSYWISLGVLLKLSIAWFLLPFLYGVVSFTFLITKTYTSDKGNLYAKHASPAHVTQNSSIVYNISWYHKKWMNIDFRSCEYPNCRAFWGRKYLSSSDAVIFDGRAVKPKDFFLRKQGQVWIFQAYEAPISFMDLGGHWTRGGWVSSFNWTMTYDKSNSDIYLPYGEIGKKTETIAKDFKGIFKNKTKTALVVHSHCDTRSKRNEFVSSLQKYLEFDSLGKCGTPWCEKRVNSHKDCFEIVNEYKFYFAFENAFCNQYFTEKLFSNFNYDSIMVVRGGLNTEIKQKLPTGTYISTGDFESIKSLADYLTNLSKSERRYTEILKRKSQYYSVPGMIFQRRAYCELCERMNKQDQYRKQISNIVDWAYGLNPCKQPNEVNDLNET